MQANKLPPPRLPASFQQWRLELFFKSPDDLRSQIPFLKKHGIARVNLTNKSNDDKLLQSAKILQEGLPAVDVCVHYSLKYNYDRSPAAVLAKLQSFCSNLQQQSAQPAAPAASCNAAAAAAASSPKRSKLVDKPETGSIGDTEPATVQPASCHVLLVSGGGKKKSVDSVAALQQLQQRMQEQQQQQQAATLSSTALTRTAKQARKRTRADQQAAAAADDNGHIARTAVAAAAAMEAGNSWPSFAVAFNPYLPQQHEAAAEKQRLRAKLATGLVDRVYLQMGTDLGRLSEGLSYAQGLLQELCGQQGDCQPPQLLGSVFVPSKRLLSQMKFRPWNGVFLSEEYLSSVAAADAITRKLLAMYAAAGVVPLVETAVKSDAEMAYVMELLGSAAASTTSEGHA